MTTRPKQANNKNVKFKNYLFAKMQCKGQGYMILKRYQLKIQLVGPIEKLFKAYLALANVPMWYYGFKPCSLLILPIT